LRSPSRSNPSNNLGYMGSNPMDKGSRSGRVLGLVGTLRICRMKAAGMEHLDLELEASEDLIGMYTTKADTR
jgi:hypothetical protein